MKYFAAALGIALVSAHGGKQNKGHVHQKKAYVSVPSVVIPPPVPEVERTVTGPECPLGFAFNGRICEQTVMGEFQTICNIGELAGGQCIVGIEQARRCPAGYHPAGEQCIQRLTEQRLEYCPQGYSEVSGRCQAKQPAEVINRCNVGIEEHGRCVVREFEAPILSRYCPAGFSEGQSGCFRSEQFDCTPVHVSHPVHVKKGHGGHGHGHKSHKVHLKHAKKQIVPMPVIQPVEVVQKLCERQIAGDYITERSCPAGTIDDGVRCIREVFETLVPVCTAMGGPQDCYTLEHTAQVFDCPAGYMMAGYECVMTLYENFEYYCAPGTMLVGGRCVTYHQPQDICAAGYEMVLGQCQRSEFAQPQYEICTICTGESCVPQAQVVKKGYTGYAKKGGHGHGHGKW